MYPLEERRLLSSPIYRPVVPHPLPSLGRLSLKQHQWSILYEPAFGHNFNAELKPKLRCIPQEELSDMAGEVAYIRTGGLNTFASAVGDVITLLLLGKSRVQMRAKPSK